MPKYAVDVVESDHFIWGVRLEERVLFDTIEAAQAYQQQYNEEGNSPLVKGNIIYARPPYEIKEIDDDKI